MLMSESDQQIKLSNPVLPNLCVKSYIILEMTSLDVNVSRVKEKKPRVWPEKLMKNKKKISVEIIRSA